MCLGASIASHGGSVMSVRLVHRSSVHELVRDLADPRQHRFSELVRMVAPASAPSHGSGAALLAPGSPFADSLAPLAPSQRSAHVEAEVLRVVRELTGEATAPLIAETPLMEAGIDSLAATELSSRLRTLTGMTLSSTLVFEHPTPRAIAVHLLESMSVTDKCSVSSMIPVQLDRDDLDVAHHFSLEDYLNHLELICFHTKFIEEGYVLICVLLVVRRYTAKTLAIHALGLRIWCFYIHRQFKKSWTFCLI